MGDTVITTAAGAFTSTVFRTHAFIVANVSGDFTLNAVALDMKAAAVGAAAIDIFTVENFFAILDAREITTSREENTSSLVLEGPYMLAIIVLAGEDYA